MRIKSGGVDKTIQTIYYGRHMNTLIEIIEAARDRQDRADLEWLKKLPPLNPKDFPDNLTYMDIMTTSDNEEPGLSLLNAYLDKNKELGRRFAVAGVLEDAFKPVVHGVALENVLGRDITLGDLRSIGIEGLRTFDNLRDGFDLDIAATILIPSQ